MDWSPVGGEDLHILRDEVVSTIRELQEVGRSSTVLGIVISDEILSPKNSEGLTEFQIAARSEMLPRDVVKKLQVLEKAEIVFEEDDRYKFFPSKVDSK